MFGYDVPEIAKQAVARVKAGDTSGADWIWFHCATPEDRGRFDAYLVRIEHPLAYQPGTRETRWRAYIAELANT